MTAWRASDRGWPCRSPYDVTGVTSRSAPTPSGRPSRRRPAGGRPPARAVGERVVLRPAPRRRRRDVRRHAGPTWAGPRSCCGPTPASPCARTAWPSPALLQELTEAWPVAVDRLALVGHSMGGLIVRAACAVRSEASRPWDALVTDVVTLGTPHLGAPARRRGRHGCTGPDPAARDRGLRADPRPALGRACSTSSRGWTTTCRRCRTPATTWSRRRSPARRVTRWGASSATSSCASRRRTAARPVVAGHPGLFPGADELHLPRAGHFDLLNHPRGARGPARLAGLRAPSEGKSAVGEQGPSTRGSVGRYG